MVIALKTIQPQVSYCKLFYVIINNFIISYLKPFHFRLFKLVISSNSIKSYFTSCFFFQSSLMSNCANIERNSKNTGQNLKTHQFEYIFKIYHVFLSLSTLHLVFQTTPHVFNEDKVLNWAWAFWYFTDNSNIIFKVFLHICLTNLNIKKRL